MFDNIETSISDGRPVELVHIAYAGFNWYYTTTEEPIDYNGNTYYPLPIMRDDIKPTGDTAKAGLNIRVPMDTPVGELFRIQPPSGVVTLTLYGEHYGDNDFKVLWKGRIINSQWEPPWMTLTTESVISSLQRVGLRRKYSTQCPFALYSGECGVSQETYKEDHTASAVSATSITFPGIVGKPANYFAGGFIQWVHSTRNTIERRAVKSSNGTTGVLVVNALPLGLSAGQVVSLYPGCDHTLSVCDSKFGNSLNFGGTPFIPTKNPFSGSSIY